MHEASLITSLLKIAHRVKIQNELDTISKVTIVVGDMHQVISDVMQNCFDLLKDDFQGFDNAQLIIKHTPLKIRCKECQKIITLNQTDFHCPHCHSTSTEIVSGQELFIETLEAE
ncbi:MAG: hydrogenase maturation nickel metallochaperone HypA [Candidatus Stygibacter australis]|nr:hydrogenase maturation nickel metallochaperone HypA [Candidatus Stygibacter australis]MDP8322302.1 hydrogenase maturation nickel metallochaperone HypA [Candidatus Stygibacter australis]